MKKQTILKSILCFLLGFVCNVAWAQTAYTVTKSSEKPADGYYVINAACSHGSGWVWHNSETTDRPFRAATDIDLTTSVSSEQKVYIWKLTNNADGSFTLLNIGTDTYLPADSERNKNMMQCTDPVGKFNFTDVEGSTDSWFVYQTNYTNGANKMYIHCNKPSYLNLSYWDSYEKNGTSIRAQFYKVDMASTTYTINYLLDGETIKTTAITYPEGSDMPEDLIENELPEGYYIVNSTSEGTTYTVNVALDIRPSAGKYYRIGYDFGAAGVKYMQSTNSPVKGLAMTEEKGEGSIFLVEEIDGNLRLKSITTGKYLKEDGGNRGLYDTGGNVTFTIGTNSKIKIQAPAYLHPNNSGDNYFIDHCGNDGCAQHNLIVEEVMVRSLQIDGPAYVGASATWNGETKALPATWAIFDGITISNPTLSISCPASYTFTGLAEGTTSLGNTVEISSLTADRTITANFSMAFFSASTAEKDLVPVRIRSARDKAYTLRLNTNDNYTGKAVNSGVTAYGENELWYLVGTKESFKIYNRVAGTSLHIVLAGTGEGSAASMNNTANNADYCLVTKDNGYAICPKGNTGQSFNMYGGAGADIKLYGAGDGGSIWTIEKMDITKPLTLNVEVDQVWESSPRVAELTFTIDGLAGQTRILGSVEGQKLYIPTGATYEVSSMTYRGYTYNGCTEEAGVLTASYTANDERTLFYSPRDGHPYRIPAIATAANDDVFAICDYRPCGNDIGYGEVDLVCRVSSDHGVTWTEERTIADGHGYGIANNDTSKIWQVGFGDPAIVADRESNKVLVMSVCGNRTCWDGNFGDPNPNPNRVSRIYITYDEEKKEWVYGQPEEVTYDIYRLFENKNGGEAYVASMFIGAGKICQSRVVKKGDYYRLYCAVWAVTKSIRQHHNYVIYSDDFGKTWNVLGDLGYENSASKWGNEPKCEELPDGTVVLSSRKYNGRYFNLFKFDDDTYTTGSWLGEVGSNEIQGGLSFGGNSTNGEIYKVKAVRKSDEKVCDLMFQSIPTGNDRSNVAIYYKEMEYNEDGTNKYTSKTFAQGWTKGKHVSEKASCYSTMILQADGRIGFFFEEVPGGYCMVYIPYTIEELTGNQYTLYVDEEDTADIEVPTANSQQSTAIYDLQGRRVVNPTKGVYIVGGRKVIF